MYCIKEEITNFVMLIKSNQIMPADTLLKLRQSHTSTSIKIYNPLFHKSKSAHIRPAVHTCAIAHVIIPLNDGHY